MSIEERRYSEDGRRRYIVRWRERGLSRQRAFDRQADARDYDNARKRLNKLARKLGIGTWTLRDPPEDAPRELAHEFRALQREIQARELAAPYGPKQGPPAPPLLPSVPERDGIDESGDEVDYLPEAHRRALFAGIEIMDDELHEAMSQRLDELHRDPGSREPPDTFWWMALSGLPDLECFERVYADVRFQRKYYIAFIQAAARLSEAGDAFRPRSAAEAFAVEGIVEHAKSWLEMENEETAQGVVDARELDWLAEISHELTCPLCAYWDVPADATPEDVLQVALDWFEADDGSVGHPLLWNPPPLDTPEALRDD